MYMCWSIWRTRLDSVSATYGSDPHGLAWASFPKTGRSETVKPLRLMSSTSVSREKDGHVCSFPRITNKFPGSLSFTACNLQASQFPATAGHRQTWLPLLQTDALGSHKHFAMMHKHSSYKMTKGYRGCSAQRGLL